MISLEQVKQYRCLRFEDMPSVPLYMDQVVMIVGEALSIFSENGEPIITPTMINNYVKQKMIKPSTKKKYDKEHIAKLIIISLFKKIFLMNEISWIMDRILDTFGVKTGYDMFASRLEKLLLAAFNEGSVKVTLIGKGNDVDDLLQIAILSFVGKLLVQNQVPKIESEKIKKK